MGELLCVDGSVLDIVAVPCRDRSGQEYEMILELARDREPFATVGQPCGHQLAELANLVRAAREDPEQRAWWPDPDDRFPVPAQAGRLGEAEHLGAAGQCALAGFQPDEREYFTLRSRDRGDLPGTGEVRCVLRSTARWEPWDGGGKGRWLLSRRAVVEAWGDSGTGVRALLTSAELVAFLDTVLGEPDGTDVVDPPIQAEPSGALPRRLGWPGWRQRGRVPDGSERSRLPAL
jgi:hypothetical protein